MHAEVTSRARREAKAGPLTKTVNLALQGGGAHGAFAWGVLDRLLDDERIQFEGLSATSAGSMNAIMLAHGLTVGGREGAQRTLAEFWSRVSQAAATSPLQPSWLDRLLHNHSIEGSPAFFLFDLITRFLSPYEFNPLNFNPLQDVVAGIVDFERLRRQCAIKLFLCATNVRTGKIKIFDNKELSLSAVMASGCLPFMFHAVEIDGQAYWDGGYMGNPAIFPLVYNCESADIIVIHINPIERHDVPRNARDILNRLNEISFNSTLMREMRAVAFVHKLMDTGELRSQSFRRPLIHDIDAAEFLRGLGVASKLNADWEFLTHLRDIGRECTGHWIAANFDRLGVESTVDIRAKYL